MTSEVKILLAAESKPQMDEVREFLGMLDQNGQRSLLDFLQGARFMQVLMTAQTQREQPMRH